METLKMSGKERRRLEVMSRVRGGELKLVKAVELLGLSYRQGKRVYQRYLADGDRGLVHGLRGKASNRRRRFVNGCWPKACGNRSAEAKPHRRRRPRKEHRGEMLQLDGSHHDWFEGRRAWAVLMVAIDDATGEVYARFFEEETTEAALRTFRRYLERHGIPQALYVDRDSIYRSDREATADEILRGEVPCTQFGRAMRQLGVRLIMAQPTGPGPRGTLQPDVAGSPGESAPAATHQRPGDGQRVPGRRVPRCVQRAVCREAGLAGGPASTSPRGLGTRAGILDVRGSRRTERLDDPLAQSLAATDERPPRIAVARAPRDGLRAIGRPTVPALRWTAAGVLRVGRATAQAPHRATSGTDRIVARAAPRGQSPLAWAGGPRRDGRGGGVLRSGSLTLACATHAAPRPDTIPRGHFYL